MVAHPQFILTSATIGNPRELGERLIEAPVELVDQDGSGRGERHFLLYNPPVIDEALGLRKSSLHGKRAAGAGPGRPTTFNRSSLPVHAAASKLF